MREHALEAAVDAPAREAPARPPVEHDVLRLQTLIGNRGVARVLARTTTAPPDPATQARADAEALARRTKAKLDGPLLTHMRSHTREIIRNTAELFSGASPLLDMQPITRRPDAATLGNRPDWADPTLYTAFFTGVTMDNVVWHQNRMIGTLTGRTMYVAGTYDTGGEIPLEEMAQVCAHECSHYFVSQYGEMPGSDRDSSSLDRYKDEFRAYWVEGRVGAGLDDAHRAQAIREQLVGTRNDPASGYPDLHRRYFNDADFQRDVDAVTGPVGFNLNNSLRLHRLWQLLHSGERDHETISRIVLVISGLSVDERREARDSPLIRGLVSRLGEDAERVRASLDQLTSPRYGAFVAAMIAMDHTRIVDTYRALPAGDKQAMAMNAGFLFNVTRLVPDTGVRARIFAMATTGEPAQYEAVGAFLAALRAARASHASTMTDDLDAALRGLRDRARWAFFSWEREGAMREYVDVLDPALARAVRERLRA